MNLSNFEEFINEVILERGKNYFRLGRYKLMHCIDNQFTYQVYGTRNYTSKVTFKAGSLHSYACDCPYDMGPICKHIVCVLYDIKENRRDDSDIGLSNIDELLDGFSESKMRNELKKLLELNPTYLQKLLFKHGYFNADSISDLVSRAFYAANIDCDDYDYVELDDFSDILIGVVKKIEKSHSLAEMILITKDIKQEVEDLFISFYGFSDYLDDNETYYFPEFVETYLYQYRDNKSEEDIELIVDTYVDEFIDTVDYHKNYIPVGILYSLMQFNYSQYAVNKIDEIISDIQENAINADPFKRSDLLTQPPKLYSAYKRKALKQNKILLTLDHFLYDYAINDQDNLLAQDIVDRNFLLDTYFFKKKVSSLMNHQIYDELEVLLKSDFSHRLPIFQLEDMKEDLYKKMNRSDELRHMYLTQLNRNFSKETYLKFKKLSNELELKKLLRAQVNKYLKKRYVPSDLIDILMMEDLKDNIFEFVKNDHRLVPMYYELISDRYKTQLNDIYKQYLYDYSQSVNKRSQYQRLCYAIEKYRKLTGLEINSIVNELKVIHRRRPAMIDELSKINMNE